MKFYNRSKDQQFWLHYILASLHLKEKNLLRKANTRKCLTLPNAGEEIVNLSHTFATDKQKLTLKAL